MVFRFYKILFSVMILAGAVFYMSAARAEDKWCICYSNLDSLQEVAATTTITAVNGFKAICDKLQDSNADCATLVVGHADIRAVTCVNPMDAYGMTAGSNNETTCRERAGQGWEQYKQQRIRERTQYVEGYVEKHGQFIPKCLVREDGTLSEQCKDVSIFVQLLINFGGGLLAIIGGLALVFFIYGGFTLILSQGNPEKVKKGRDIIAAAAVGIIIAFAAYAAIYFLGEAVGLSSTDYKLKQ